MPQQSQHNEDTGMNTTTVLMALGATATAVGVAAMLSDKKRRKQLQKNMKDWNKQAQKMADEVKTMYNDIMSADDAEETMEETKQTGKKISRTISSKAKSATN